MQTYVLLSRSFTNVFLALCRMLLNSFVVYKNINLGEKLGKDLR